MDTTPLDQTLDRTERALLRIERSIERGAMHRAQDDGLRQKVTAVLGDLDALLREAGR